MHFPSSNLFCWQGWRVEKDYGIILGRLIEIFGESAKKIRRYQEL
jgi:hypothetical protein